MSKDRNSARETFESISHSVISYLEEQVGVSGVHFADRPPAAPGDIDQWEQDNYPLLLPTELKNFLLISDGLLLRWYINYKEDLHPLGLMYLNSIAQLKRIKQDHFKFAPKDPALPISETDTSEDDEEPTNNKSRRNRKEPLVFELDATSPEGGRVGLVYHSRTGQPSVWFQDFSCVWFFVADTFADYFRLMLVHLGLPHWQHVFTDVGLDPLAMQWFRFVCPERLALDLKHARRQDSAVEEVAKQKKDQGSTATEPKPLRLKDIDDAIASGASKPKTKSSVDTDSRQTASRTTSRMRSRDSHDSDHSRPASAFRGPDGKKKR